ncbi:MAG: HEAT repeat domain-containing protein, partial [Bacteroidota bacterium]
MTIQFVILLALTIGTTFFVTVVSIGLVIHKGVTARSRVVKDRLYSRYSGMIAEVLLGPLPEDMPAGPSGARLRAYDTLCAPVAAQLKWKIGRARELHRAALRLGILNFAQDVTGESLDRLTHLSYYLGFVDEEIRRLGHRHWWIRSQAARDLGLMRARKATSLLMERLDDPHPDVRNQARESLVVIVGVESLREILKRSRNLTRWSEIELSVIVMRFKESAVPYLVEALAFADQSVVLFCVEMLAEIGFVTAVEPLLALATRYPNVRVRSRAMEALGRLGDERAEKLLRSNVTNPNPILRLSALRALGFIGSPSAVPSLLDRFERGELQEKILAGGALVKAGTRGKDMLL